MNEIFIDNSILEEQKIIAATIKSEFQKQGIFPKIYIETYGCQQNDADSERIMGACKLCGYTPTDKIECADLVVINTCAIREHAELKAFSNAGEIRRLKEKNKNMIFALCGCMAQEKHVRDKLYKSYPYIDVVFGTDMHHRVPEILRDTLKSKKRLCFINELPHQDFGVISENMPIERASKIHAWVSVMYGCNNYCTYCIVPYVRGRERSRRSDEIITEVKSLIANGCKDITLLGQNVNSYSDNCTFPQLLDKISSLDGEFRLRFMTSHPKDASHELVDIMSKNNKIARHFHLPVQSGSDRILKLMNRSYTREQYIEKALYIKQKMPDISLTSDIICGFPGETDEDFEQTVSLIEQLQLDMIYAFIYSPRVGTLAEKMENQISHSKKVERFEYLSKIQNDIALKINETYIGKTIEILSDESKSGIFTGRTTQNKIVSLDKFIEPGKFAYAKIISAHPYSLDGVLV